MPISDRLTVFLGALALKGDKARLIRESQALLDLKDSACAAVEMLSVHLVDNPDADLFAMLMQHVKENPLPRNDAGDRAYLTLFFAAGVMRDKAALAYIQVLLKERSGGPLLSLSDAEEFFTDNYSLLRLESFLPVMPISMDMAYALHERNAKGSQHPPLINP
jgi:hypothetical protein